MARRASSFLALSFAVAALVAPPAWSVESRFASLPLAGAKYTGTADVPIPPLPDADTQITLRVSRSGRAVRFERLRLYATCPRGGIYVWYTYALRPVRTRGGRFSTRQRFSSILNGRRFRASIRLRGVFSDDGVPGAEGRLAATMKEPPTPGRRAQTCRTGRKRFDMAVTAGIRTKVGTLKQRGGRHGCVAPKGRARCADMRGLLGRSMVIAPDGRNVYVAAPRGVLAFSRNSSTGALTQLDGASGCLSMTGRRGCARSIRMRSPTKVAVSPHGIAVYVAWYDPYSTPPRTGASVLRRDPVSGALAELPGETGCADNAGRDGCTDWREISDTSAITIAPDGRNLYVGVSGFDDGAALDRGLATLNLDPRTGGLRIPGSVGCMVPGSEEWPPEGNPTGSDGCEHLFVESDYMTFDPDGRHLYTRDRVFSRDPVSGVLAPVAGRRGCYWAFDPDLEPAPACTLLRPFSYNSGERPIAAAPDGRSVYMGDELAVGAFARDQETGTLRQLPGRGGCVRLDAGKGCSHARSLVSVDALAVAPDGRTVYAAAYLADAIVVLHRNRRTGVLRQIGGRNGCLGGGDRRENETLSCAAARALELIWDLTMSPDGRHLYALSDSGIAIFARRAR